MSNLTQEDRTRACTTALINRSGTSKSRSESRPVTQISLESNFSTSSSIDNFGKASARITPEKNLCYMLIARTPFTQQWGKMIFSANHGERATPPLDESLRNTGTHSLERRCVLQMHAPLKWTNLDSDSGVKPS